MALALIYNNLQTIWPFSALKFDDIKASNVLVRKLPIPENTKEFVFAVFEPESKATIYILSAQNLSEQSALDAECLIRGVRPDAVVAQVGDFSVSEIQSEERECGENVDNPVPTSSFGVVKRCFMQKINREKYENVAGNFVLREIFGVGFHGHLLVAKKAAKEVGSSFLVLESPFVKSLVAEDKLNEEATLGNKLHGLVSSLAPQKVGSVLSWGSKRFSITNDVQLQMVRLLSSNMDVSVSKLTPSSSDFDGRTDNLQPRSNYEAPPFAQSIYTLLTDLHDIFVDLPMLGRALAHAQKMFSDVNRGELVDTQLLHEVYTFRVAVEGLRIALHNAGRLPISKIGNSNMAKTEFSNLSLEDKSHALLAQALRSQTKKFKTIVAVVDASGLAGLRKHWNTPVPPEVKEMVGELVTNCEDDEEVSKNSDRKRLLASKPVVAVGAGATAILGVSSLSKAVPASTVMKVVTFKVPASLKLILTQTQKVVAFTLSKTLGPSKVVAHGIASSGVKSSSMLKATASAEKIRAVAHSVIASMEKTSLSAMRTAFYEIMRKRQVRRIGFLPWATFGCSITACSGLLVFGDGIECAAESLPAAPSIASLGRGIQSLHQASQAARQADSTKIQKSVESLMYRIKKAKGYDGAGVFKLKTMTECIVF